MGKQIFMIIDGNALVHRAFHALPPLSTKDGTLVNAVYGFTTVLMKALNELKPYYAAVAFDLKGPTFRDELYKAYKAQRVKQPQELYDQLPLVKEVVRAFGIPVVEKQGYEADDVIATLSKNAKVKSQNLETIVVTGDMDTLQLVDEHTKVYSFRKGFSDTVIYDENAVKERFGLRPDQMVDYKALRGDPSDNIPGVKGVGEKTAAELVRQFGSVEKLYKSLEQGNAETLKQKNVTPRTKELLVTYKEDAVLGKKLVQLVRDVPIEVSIEECKIQKPNTEKLQSIFEKFEFKNLLARLAPVQPKKTTQLFDADSATPKEKIPEFIYESGIIYGHDLKAQRRLGSLSFSGEKLFDTMVASYLLHPGGRMHDLDDVLREHNIGRDERAIYDLAVKLRDDLSKENLIKVFEEIEMPLLPVLAQMEAVGIKVDTAYLKKLSKEFEKTLKILTEKIYKQAGEEFNIASPVQLREVLFEKMKLAPASGRIKKTTKGKVASTAAGELEKLRGVHPIVDLIFEYREIAKLQSTYTDALIALVDKKDGRVHTTFNQAVTSTGRLSSSEPNLQNIPIRTDTGRLIRKAFVAEKGYVLLSADYSQIELRVAASLSGDPEMIKAFLSGHDFHTKTAALLAGVLEDKITPQMRRNAKAVNFGIIYGMGATSLAQSTGMPRSEAEQFIERYFEVFHILYDYLEGLKEQARTLGYVETLFGRRRYLPEINSGVQQVRAAAERMAVNMPIQGTATGDLMKMAMLQIHENTKTLKHENKVRMLLQVHDELVFEVREGEVGEIAPRIKQAMENVHEFKVPIVVETKIGYNWGEMK